MVLLNAVVQKHLSSPNSYFVILIPNEMEVGCGGDEVMGAESS